MIPENNIEKFLCPNQYTFKIIDDEIHTEILDLELDPIKCIIGAYFIELNTEGLSYIHLDIDKLQIMIKLIKQAKKYYNQKYLSE